MSWLVKGNETMASCHSFQNLQPLYYSSLLSWLIFAYADRVATALTAFTGTDTRFWHAAVPRCVHLHNAVPWRMPGKSKLSKWLACICSIKNLSLLQIHLAQPRHAVQTSKHRHSIKRHSSERKTRNHGRSIPQAQKAMPALWRNCTRKSLESSTESEDLERPHTPRTAWRDSIPYSCMRATGGTVACAKELGTACTARAAQQCVNVLAQLRARQSGTAACLRDSCAHDRS